MSRRIINCSIYRTFVIILFVSILTGAILSRLCYPGRFVAMDGGPLDTSRYGRRFDTVPCRLPVIDPFDDSIKEHMRKTKYWKCPNIPSVVHVDEYNILRVNSSALGFFGLKNPSDLKCTTEDVYRRHVDKKVGFRKAVPVTPPVKLSTDFTRVRCKNGSDTVFDNIVAGISEFTRVGGVPVDTETDEQQLSVFWLGIDSTSRSESIRSLPNTLKYLKDIGAYDFEGHMSIGKNTMPNIFPLLTGVRTAGEDDPDPVGYMDDWPYLWNNFSRKGYATLYSEDYPSLNTFNNHGRKGFVKIPVDHYMRPFWVAMKTSDAFGHDLTNKSKFHKFNNERKYTSYMCHQNTRQYMDAFNYVRRFMMRYKGRRKFVFSFLNDVSRHSKNHLKSADEDFRELFVWLHDQGFLDRMVVAFFGDHGYRFGSLRNTYIGRLEATLPMLHLLVPEGTKRKYPDVDTSLTRNTKRLTSNFDLRQTFIDILYKNYNHPSKGEVRGISFFREIPESRSCADAGILAHLCSCLTSHDSVVKNDAFVMKIAHKLVNHLNNIIGNASDCEKIKFHIIKSAHRLTLESEQDAHPYVSIFRPKMTTMSPIAAKNMFRVVIETNPGPALFETVCEVDESQGSYHFADVDRTNAYGNQSYCVEAAKLKPYCYCKGYE